LIYPETRMPAAVQQKPVEDSVARINDEVAVGEDLDFQRRWWKFENAVWIFFAIVLLCTFAGLLGRGPLATTHRGNASLDIQYERIARTGTPNMLEVKFTPQAIRNGRVQLFVSDSIVKQFGAQRVIPAPLETSIGEGGLTYTFPASAPPASVKFALQPDGPGIFHFAVGIPGEPPVEAKVIVLP